MRTTILTISAALALGALSGCGSDLTCGSGTRESGEKCVAVTMGSAGSSGTPDGGGPSGAPPAFDGVASVAPVTDSSLQVTWDPALDDSTERENLIYRVYVGTAAGEQ